MDHKDYTTELLERKRGQHLRQEECGAIKALHSQGYSLRKIARVRWQLTVYRHVRAETRHTAS